MGSWGYYNYPTEPPDKPEFVPDYKNRDWWEEMAEVNSMSDFIEQEVSYADSLEVAEDIATDEGGWGAWMGGEL